MSSWTIAKIFVTFLIPLIIDNNQSFVLAQNQNCASDVQFGTPDIVVQYSYPTKSVTLEAFKVRNRTQNEPPKWFSIGYPTIVNQSGQIFHFTSEYISVVINTLDQAQKQALFHQAKHQYPNEHIHLNNFLPLPLAQFSCFIKFYHHETIKIYGDVHDLQRHPFLLRFFLHEGNQKRLAFEQRLLRSSDPLYLECELAATEKQEKIQTLKITMDQIREIGLGNKILGTADQKYVLRQQLHQLSLEVKSHFRIQENYEFQNENFEEKFIEKIFDGSSSRFEFVSIDEALNKLSTYGITFVDQCNLSPNAIKNELSKKFEIKDEGIKEYIIAIGTATDHNSSNPGMGNALELLDLSGAINFVKSKSHDWTKNLSNITRMITTMSVDDQLRDLNRHTFNTIQWQRDGHRIIPKSLKVAKVTRMMLNRQMVFSKIKERITDAKYHRSYEMGTSEILGRNVEQPQIKFVGETGAGQQSNFHEEVRLLKRLIANVTNLVEAKNNEMARKVDDVKSSLQETKTSLSSRVTEVAVRQSNITEEVRFLKRLADNITYLERNVQQIIILRGSSITKEEVQMLIKLSIDNVMSLLLETKIEIEGEVNNVNSSLEEAKSVLNSRVDDVSQIVTNKNIEMTSKVETVETLLEDSKTELTREINNVKTSSEDARSILHTRVDEVSETLTTKINNAMTTTCVIKETTNASSTDRLNLNARATAVIGLPHIDCRASAGINDIHWGNWTEIESSRADKGYVLSANYNCCSRQGTDCMRKSTNSSAHSESIKIPIKNDRLALKYLDCGGSEWYINNIIWQNWNSGISSGEVVWYLNAKFRCCKRGK